MGIVNLIEHWLGMTNASGKTYLFWSGFFGNVSIFAAALGVARHVNCHVKGCWRVGKHGVDGTPFKVCALHHPEIDGRPSHQDVLDAHAATR